MNQAKVAARRAANSSTMTGLARSGLIARAIIYFVIGWLALQIALGHHSHQANQKGALAEIAQHTGGVVLLWVLVAGFADYAIWRFREAAFGTPADGTKAGPRLQSLGRGIGYAALAVSTVSYVLGRSPHSQAQQQASMTARVMRHGGGRWLVGLIGLIVVVVGIVMVVEGITGKFTRELRSDGLAGRTRTVVTWLGGIGTVARGLVFALAGALGVQAAVTFDASDSTGVDGALRTLADRTLGGWLLAVLAVGLIVFGIYGLAAARWVRT